ncbi:MAG: leucyl/phenylalanyl-tRNA--protein transferase [Ignavibacteria bacterium]|nr:leucyl/phenylalanyl-tRNA--protein transferase [Ignavibacteria bacterium]
MYFEVDYNTGKKVTTDVILNAYSKGIFPMADNLYGRISWYFTNPRAVINLEDNFGGLHIPRSLFQVIKKNIYETKFDNDFNSVILNCAEREHTWISREIISLYTELHKLGYAHSVEAYKNGELAGGLYGIAYKGAFFGESMFHKYPNASKVAVYNLYQVLIKNNYLLFDIQMMTSVFKIFGAIHIPFSFYLEKLKVAMQSDCKFLP